MKTLADALGLDTPTPNTAEPSANPSKKTSAKAFSKHILDSKEYAESILRRIKSDSLPPAVEVLLHHYANGKPVDRVDIRDKTNPLEGMTMEQLEVRALRLAALAAKLKKQTDETTDADAGHHQVH